MSTASYGFAEPPQGKKPTIRTPAHDALLYEAPDQKIPATAVVELEAILTDAVKELSEQSDRDRDTNDPQVARALLKRIDDLLVARRYVCEIPCDSLTDGFEPRPLSKITRGLAENIHRRKRIDAMAHLPVRRFDCDTGCIIYLSIAQLLHLPLHMVEAPRHTFIRWRLQNGEAVNWDVNFAHGDFSNGDYQAKYGPPPGRAADGAYYRDLNRDEVDGLLRMLAGIRSEAHGDLRAATVWYSCVCRQYPTNSNAPNNLAWMYVLNHGRHGPRSITKAIDLAKTAVQLDRTANHLDTLACLMAMNNRFDEAVKLETEAVTLSNDPEMILRKAMFEAGRPYDPAGDRRTDASTASPPASRPTR